MASGTDFAQEYGQAEKAYMQGNYQEAATICDRLVEDFPENPSVRLLLGHIYCYGLQQYDVARQQYEAVLTLTSEQDFIEYANNGLEYANQLMNGAGSGEETASSDDFDISYGDLGETDELGNPSNFENWSHLAAEDDVSSGFDLGSLDFDEVGSDTFTSRPESPFDNPFGGSGMDEQQPPESGQVSDTPFAFSSDFGEDSDDLETFGTSTSGFELDDSVFGSPGLEDTPEEFFPDPGADETDMTFVIPGSSRQHKI